MTPPPAWVPAPVPAAPGVVFQPVRPRLTPAENILHEQIGPATGSNPGGVYRGADGVERYVKFYSDPAQAHGEHLANELYRELGLAAPMSQTFTASGRSAYASELVEGVTTLGKAGLTETRAKKILEGFAADVLLANWDAAGANLDNILVGSRGRILRVDNGGALLMRAKAGRKPRELLDQIPEWTGFFDSYKNPAYARIAKAAGVGRAEDVPKIGAQIRKIVALRKRLGGWESFVDRAAPGLADVDRAAVVRMLEHRTDLLAAKLKAMEAAARQAKKLARQAPPRVQELLARTYRSFTGTEDARAHGQALVGARLELHPGERSALRRYTGSTYRDVNGALRSGGTHPDVAHLDGALRLGRLVEDIQVVRGLDDHPFLRQLERGIVGPGDIFSDPGYTSISLASQKAFSGKYQLRIRVPKEAVGLYVDDLSQNPGELELLLPRDAKIQILSVKKDGYQWRVECLLIE